MAVAGQGVPLVVVHGFAAEGVLYSQTLSRLVEMGFMVVAIDSPGHGATDSLPPFADLSQYVQLIASTIEALGIHRAVLVGHSMGGRLVAELAAADPDLPIAVMLIDAITGDVWDRMNVVFRAAPAAYGALAVTLVADTLTTLPVMTNPAQAMKLARLVFPIGANHVRRPWRLLGPFVSIVRATPSHDTLDQLRADEVPVVVVHGDCDLAVPVCTGRAAAARAGADLVVVHGARHSWLLRDPETFPAILAEQLAGRVGDSLDATLAAHGLDRQARGDQLEPVFYRPGAPVLELSPAPPSPDDLPPPHGPRYRWTTTPAAGR